MAKSLIGGIKKHRIALLKLVFVIVDFIIALDIIFFAVSTNSKVCAGCHYMRPYYRQWKESTHKGVACVECHPNRVSIVSSAAVKYITNTYNPRPHAKVEDRSCMQKGCHQDRLLKGKVAYKGSISFDHAQHVGKLRRGEELRCTSCHSQVVQGTHISVSEKVCFLCHFKGAARGHAATGCPSCHGIPTKVVEHEGFYFSHESYLKAGIACDQCHLDVAAGDGKVSEEKCYKCHIEKTADRSDVLFIHDKHVTGEAVNCFECHEEIRHGQIRMIKTFEVSCENCHVKLHSMQKEMYMGTGGRGVIDIPSRMFAAQVSCDGCHTRVVQPAETGGLPMIGERSLEAQKESCVACHGSGYDLLLDDWQGVLNEHVAEFEPMVLEAGKKLSECRRSDADFLQAKELIDDATYNFNFVKIGKGVHNIEYAVKLIQTVADQIDTAMKIIVPEAKPMERDRLLGTPDGYCAILCHNRLGLPAETPFPQMAVSFPHQAHTETLKVPCTTCHSPEKHKMRIISKEGCMECHHKNRDIECGSCHQNHFALYTGKVRYNDKDVGEPDVMAKTVDCTACHDLESKGKPFELVKARCVDCHGEGYGEMLIKWEQETLKTQNKIAFMLTEVKDKIESLQGGGKDVSEASRLYSDAERLFEIVEKGKGVHNHILAAKLFELCESNLTSASRLLQHEK
jgi:hypothetical protein